VKSSHVQKWLTNQFFKELARLLSLCGNSNLLYRYQVLWAEISRVTFYDHGCRDVGLSSLDEVER